MNPIHPSVPEFHDLLACQESSYQQRSPEVKRKYRYCHPRVERDHTSFATLIGIGIALGLENRRKDDTNCKCPRKLEGPVLQQKTCIPSSVFRSLRYTR